MNSSRAKNKSPAIDTLYGWLSPCSTRCLFILAKWLAFIVYHSPNQLSQQARQNIQLCFPDMPRDKQKALLRGSIHHTCCAFLELAAIWYRPLEQVLKLIQPHAIDESFLHSKNAKIIVAPHHGSWELLNLWLADSGPIFSLYKPAKSKRLDPLIMQKRTRNGAQLVPVNTAGLRRLLKGLKSGASVMILPDQRPGPQSARADAPFFGVNAPTSLLVKNLAAKSECDVFIAAVTRELKTGKYRLCIQPLQRETLLGDDAASASYLNLSIEHFVRPHLQQYQWTYRRFERSRYPNNSAD